MFAAGEAFFSNGKLVHEAETEVGLLRSEIDFDETRGEALGGFPTDLASEARLVGGGNKIGKVFHEIEESGFQEVPIFGSSAEEGFEPKGGIFELVDVHNGKVALARGGDIETQAKCEVRSAKCGIAGRDAGAPRGPECGSCRRWQ